MSSENLKNNESEIAGVVSELAECLLEHGLHADFRAKAKSLSQVVTAESLADLRSMFHKPPAESALFKPQEHGLGGWLSACQFSIFELVYKRGKEALPFVREIAWGEYDWTQGNAIEILIRFAAYGIERDTILNEIKQNFPDIRYEARLYAIEPLLPELANDEKLKQVFDELFSIEEFKEAFAELTAAEV